MRFEELASKAAERAVQVGRQVIRPAFAQVLANHRRRTIISAWSTAAVVLVAVVLGGMLTWPAPGSQGPAAASVSTTTTAPSALTTTTAATSTTTQEEKAAAALADVPETCPITVPGDDAFTPASETPDEISPGDDAVWYGTPELWTKIETTGRVGDGWVHPGAKTFWWSENFALMAELEPDITVTAEHLDGIAPVVKAGGPGTNGSHPDLGDFMLVGIELPAKGCWKLTAEYKGATLSYVMWVEG